MDSFRHKINDTNMFADSLKKLQNIFIQAKSIKESLKTKVEFYKNFQEEDFVKKHLIFRDIDVINKELTFLKRYGLIHADVETKNYCNELNRYINYVQNSILNDVKQLLAANLKPSYYYVANLYYNLDDALWKEINDTVYELEKGTSRLPPLSSILQVYGILDFLCDKHNTIRDSNPALAKNIYNVLLHLETEGVIQHLLEDSNRRISYTPGVYMKEIKHFLEMTGFDNGIRLEDYREESLKLQLKN